MSIDIKHIKKEKSNKKLNKTDKEKSAIVEFFNKDIKLFNSGMKDKKKERYYADLGILLSSGIDIKTALELIVEEQKKKSDKELFNTIQNDVLNGMSLSEAMQKTDKFSNYEYFSLRIGEESGRIIEVLTELTTFYSKKIKQKRQLTSAFSYPIMVLVTAIGAIFFMMNFIVPMFEDVFKRFGGKLPALTQNIIDLSAFFEKYSGYFFLFILVIIVFLFSQKKKKWYRNISSKILLKLPLFGKIVKKMYISRYCQSMALLISSKTPMLRAIQLVRNMIGFYPYEIALDKIADDILHGKALYQSMAQFNIFERRMTSLIKVAEEVNQLDTIFERLNKQYSEELEHNIGMISSLLEPLMIVFVGCLVGVILVAMYLPLFQLSTTIY